MMRQPLVIALRIVAPLLVLAAGFGALLGLASLREKPAPRTPEPIVPAVSTDFVTAPGNETLEIEVDGMVVPHRQIEVAAEVSGRVVTKSPGCRAGRFVTAGTTLLQIDDTEYQLELARLRQEKKQAELSRDENRADIENTREIIALRQEEVLLQQAELERIQELLKSRASNVSALDQAKRARLAAQNALVTAENQLRLLRQRDETLGSAIDLAEEKIRRAQLDVDRTQVRAPIDGMVVSDHVEQDSFVQRGNVLVTIEDSTAVEVRCQLRMEELYWFWNSTSAPTDVSKAASSGPDQPSLNRHYELPEHAADILYELAGQTYVWKGRLARYEGIGLDKQTRTVPCRIVVDEPRTVHIASSDVSGDSLAAGPHPPALVRGMYVGVILKATPDVPLLEVPQAAIRPGNVVWRVDEESRLRRCPVRVASVQGDRAVLHADGSNLRRGDQVVVSTLSVEMEGSLVEVLPADADGVDDVDDGVRAAQQDERTRPGAAGDRQENTQGKEQPAS